MSAVGSSHFVRSRSAMKPSSALMMSFTPFPDVEMSPSMRPCQPDARIGLQSPDKRQAEKIVEAAAIDAGDNDFTKCEQLLERPIPQLRINRCLLPVRGAGPCVVQEPDSHLDVEVLGVENLPFRHFRALGFLELRLEPCLADRTAQVRVRNIEVFSGRDVRRMRSFRAEIRTERAALSARSPCRP